MNGKYTKKCKKKYRSKFVEMRNEWGEMQREIYTEIDTEMIKVHLKMN